MFKKILLLLFLLASQLYAANEIKIGWIGPLTGDSASLGVDSLRALKLRVNEELKNKPNLKIKIIAQDDSYITGRTLSAYKKLVHQDKVKIIFTITYGGLFAIADMAQKDGVLLLDPLDCDQRIANLPSNIICVAKLSEQLGEIAVELAVKNKLMPAGILYFNGDPFMGVVAKASLQKAKDLGESFIYNEAFYSETKDFKPMLLKAKARGVKSLFFYGYDNTGYALRQARELGINVQFFALNTAASQGFKDLAGNAINGLYISTWFPPKTSLYQNFLTNFKNNFKTLPTLLISTVPTYDIMDLLFISFNKNNLNYSDKNFVNTTKADLYSTKNFQGLSGPITIDSDGITRSLPNKMYVYNDGNFSEIK